MRSDRLRTRCEAFRLILGFQSVGRRHLVPVLDLFIAEHILESIY